MSTQSPDWQDVPLELHSIWNHIFSLSKEGINLSTPCPVCECKTLHEYYQAIKPLDRVILGQRFVAHGALWTWCSSCHSYEHFSAFVPEWWHDTLPVDETKLTHQPEALEEALNRVR